MNITTFDYKTLEYNPIQEKLLQLVVRRTGATDVQFTRLMVAYYINIIGSMMHVKVATPANGNVPINMYLFNLGESGYGKGFARYILRHMIFKNFFNRHRFSLTEKIMEKSLVKIAANSEDDLETIVGNFHSLGNYVDEFDSGTLPALKQLHYKIMMQGTGSLNFVLDEIGDNLESVGDLFKAYLELWDIGYIGDKILKVTKEQQRLPPLRKMVPTNMLCFGTPSALFDGAKSEEKFYAYMRSGFPRRSFFGYSDTHIIDTSETAEERWEKAIKIQHSSSDKKMSKRFGRLATKKNHGKVIGMDKATGILLYEYRRFCEQRSNKLPSKKKEQKAYLIHSHMKVSKLAGAYAFIENSPRIKKEHILQAIKLNEDSYKTFNEKIMSKTPNYVKLLRFMVESEIELTEADLASALPFFPTTKYAKDEIFQMAAAYGYGRGCTLTTRNVDGITLYKAEQLQKSTKSILSYSSSITKNYKDVTYDIKSLIEFLKHQGINYVNHHLKDGYRDEKHIVPGFNLIILDVDKGVYPQTIKTLFEEYEYIIYHTKRSTPKKPRFRVILFTNYILKLSKKEYKELLTKVYLSMPFKVDMQTNQRSRKWLTNNNKLEYHSGEKFNILPFIPQTKEYQKRETLNSKLGSLSALERWIISNIENGNRNEHLIRYALALVDQGYGYSVIKKKVISLTNDINKKTKEDPISYEELKSTVLYTAKKRIKEQS